MLTKKTWLFIITFLRYRQDQANGRSRQYSGYHWSSTNWQRTLHLHCFQRQEYCYCCCSCHCSRWDTAPFLICTLFSSDTPIFTNSTSSTLILPFLSDQPQKCPSGRKSDSGFTPCTNCAIGKYQPETGKTSCMVCPSGQTTDSEGSTSLSQCHDANQPCAVGTFSQSGLQPCEPCNTGTFQDGTGQKTCKQCKQNTYQVRGSNNENTVTMQYCHSAISFEVIALTVRDRRP